MNMEEFKNPGKEYRAAPFWSWNDELTNEELCWQVREMKKQGFGGYFMHSRVGLKTPYLSQEWMDRIANTLVEGKKQDMESWLYDEDQWPSGAAGGLVTAENEEYRARALRKEKVTFAQIRKYFKEGNQDEVVAIFALIFNDNNHLTAYYRINNRDDLAKYKNRQSDFYMFKIETQAPLNKFNGHCYIDVLNPAAVKKFIEITHEKYKDNFGNEFGEYMPGIFIDEPTFRSKPENTKPWTPGFEGYYQMLHGDSLIEKLPLLFYEYKGSKRVRYNYYYALTRKFLNSFTKPIYEYCQKNGLKLTGHYLREDSLFQQAGVIGAAMPHYQYMHVPGIDHLGRNINDPLTLKQCSSVAHQFGQKRVLCENFGVSGHSMTFADQKWIADFHFALGITFMCQHLVLYSMVGDRKRDYPPTFSYHQPYWQDYKLINDYFARAAWVCSQGEYQAETLVLHPVASVWANYSSNYQDNEYDRELAELQNSLLSSRIDFDYGDELIMEEEAAVIETQTPSGTLYKIKVNDSQEIKMITEPWVVDITEQLRDEVNTIRIEVVSSLRNTFGPLHHREVRPAWNGPEEFVDENNRVDSYQFEDYGLLKGATILVKK